MEFGNNLSQVKRATIVGLVIGIVVGVASFLFVGNIQPGNGKWLFMVALSPGAIMLCAVGFTALFKVRVTGEAVEHIFMNRWTLSQFPLKEFQGINRTPPVLYFSGGKKMRLVGMHVGLLSQLEKTIRDERKRANFGRA